MVKDHVKNVMGPAAAAYANTMLKMSKLQAAQVRKCEATCAPALLRPLRQPKLRQPRS